MPATKFEMAIDVIRVSTPIATLIAAFVGGGWAYKIHKDKVRHENEKESTAAVRELRLASVLVSDRLAVFVRGCLWVAADDGYDERGYPAGGNIGGFEDVLATTTDKPAWQPSTIGAEWKYLDPNLVDQLFKFALLIDDANLCISRARIDELPPDFVEYFHQRRLRYALLGLHAISLRKQVISNAGLADEGMPQQYEDAAKTFEEVKRELIDKQRLREERGLEQSRCTPLTNVPLRVDQRS